MAIAFVQSTQGGTASGTTTTTSAFGSTTTAGNAIILVVGNGLGGALSTVTDSAGNTYALVTSKSNAFDIQANVYIATNIAATAGLTVTVTAASPTSIDVIAQEFSGLQTSSPTDVFASASGNSSSPNSGATASTTVADELVIGAVVAGNSVTWTAGAGYSNLVRQAAGTAGTGIESKIVSVTGAQTATFSQSGSRQWAAIVATFKADGGSTTTSTSSTSSSISTSSTSSSVSTSSTSNSTSRSTSTSSTSQSTSTTISATTTSTSSTSASTSKSTSTSSTSTSRSTSTSSTSSSTSRSTSTSSTSQSTSRSTSTSSTSASTSKSTSTSSTSSSTSTTQSTTTSTSSTSSSFSTSSTSASTTTVLNSLKKPTIKIRPQSQTTQPFTPDDTLVDDPVALVDDPQALSGGQLTIHPDIRLTARVPRAYSIIRKRR